jgi:two-component system, NtrC family, sensor histidine kinase PilS
MTQKVTDRFALVIQSLRSGIYIFILILALMVHLGQGQFFSWPVYQLFYLTAFCGLTVSLFGLLKKDFLLSSPRLLFFTFAVDVFLVVCLQYFSGLDVTIFLFLYLIVIMTAAFTMKTKAAMVIAAFVSLGYSLISLLGPELKAITFLFQVLLYNVAFYLTAWMAAQLSEQLEAQGVTLNFLKRLNESIVETIPSGLVTVDNDGNIVSWNPGLVSILGQQPEIGASIKNLLSLHTEQSLDFLLAKENLTREIVWKTEAENKIISCRVLPHHIDNRHRLILLEDITEVRQLELRLRHQEKLAAVGGLAAGIAHELGNPLAAVSANIQFLEPKIRIEDASDQKLLDNTHKEIARLGRLIGEFKDFAKPEKVPVDPVFLDQLLRDVIEQIGHDQTTQKDVKVLSILNQVPPIRGSRDKLIQAFMNLIINAYHAVAESSQPEIKIVCVIRAGFVEVRIADNGSGMSAETKSHLFEPFFTTKGRKGTGLGLAITHKILDSHGVRVSVNSQQGEGTEFVLQFPVQQIELNH